MLRREDEREVAFAETLRWIGHLTSVFKERDVYVCCVWRARFSIRSDQPTGLAGFTGPFKLG